MKIKLWPQTEIDFDELEDRLDAADQQHAREERNRKNDEDRANKGRKRRRQKGTDAPTQ